MGTRSLLEMYRSSGGFRGAPKRGSALIILFAALLLAAGCSRHAEEVVLSAPFDRDARVGVLSASWKRTPQERVAAGPDGASRPEERFVYRATVRNELSAELFLRVGDFSLTGPDGSVIARDPKRVECRLGSRARMEVLAGSIWVPQSSVPEVTAFRVSHFAVPLSARGQALYQHWRLTSRPPQSPAELALEIGRYAAAPPCVPVATPAATP